MFLARSRLRWKPGSLKISSTSPHTLSRPSTHLSPLSRVDCPPSPILAPPFALSTVSTFSTTARTPALTFAAGGLLNKLKILSELSKLRLSSLVVFTTAAGYAATGVPVELWPMLATCVGTGMCAASAGTFNQIFEKDQDARMKRTFMRPLPAQLLSVELARGWGVAVGVTGTSLLYLTSTPVVAALGAANIALYAGLYTWLKPRSEWNTWVGSLVGAIPPVMGWAAATHATSFTPLLLAPEPLLLASILFLWQFPHFFALSFMHRQDYARGGFQMVAVNDPTGRRSARLISQYSWALAAVPLVSCALDLTSWMYAVEGTIASAYMLHLSRQFSNSLTSTSTSSSSSSSSSGGGGSSEGGSGGGGGAGSSNAQARKVFLASLWYLPLLLSMFVYHSKAWQPQPHALHTTSPHLLADQDGITAATGDEGEVEVGEVEEEVGLEGAVQKARAALKSACPHEYFLTPSTSTSTSTSNTSSSPEVALPGHAHLCVKLRVEQASAEAVDDLSNAATTAAAAAATVVTAASSSASASGETQA